MSSKDPHDPNRRPGEPEPTRSVEDFEQKVLKAKAEDPEATTRTGAQISQLNSLVIGPYKLLQQIGEGGMGTVWLADQERPVRRRVALKLIKSGADNKQVLARFEAERQALSMMDHQNIAKVLDAGTMQDGRPYFVMELVQGIPFNKYCDQNKLSINQRLELFIPICKAVQHAHQKGIIHRDLKPSNVLVCLYDGKPVPKVIDFGLAKALQLQTKLTDKTLFTEFGQVVGTLQYMSPEQAEMNQLDVDTRTDVYSLGAMLYELLTGSTPIDKETLAKEAVLKVLESIREKDPPRPSVRLSSSTNEAVTGISSQRQIEPTKLKGILRGELDWIVMKALEKDRTRRYETANGLASEIERFLTGDPVQARPPSASYRLSKYVKRHKGLVASLATIATLLLFGSIGTLWFGIEANIQKNLADKKTAEVTREKQLTAKAATEATALKIIAEQKSAETQLALDQSEATLARSNYFLANARWNENRVAEATKLLQSIPEKHRNFEWYYSRRHFLGSEITCYGHRCGVTCVAFSPDGNRIASGSADHTIKLWDAQTGSELTTFTGHTGEVDCLAFSPDGAHIASGSAADRTINLWDIRTGTVLTSFTGQRGVSSIAYSLDGNRIATGNFGEIKLLDARTGAELKTLSGHRGTVTCVAFNPDGNRIASCGVDETVRMWDCNTGAELAKFMGHVSWVSSVNFSPDGTRLASSSGGEIKVWDAETEAELITFRGHGHVITSVAFSPDSMRLVSGGRDNTIKIWNSRTGAELITLLGHTDWVTSVRFSPDGARVVSGSTDKTIKLWDATSNLRGSNLATLSGHTDDVTSVIFSPDGTQLASGSGDLGRYFPYHGYRDNTIKLWDAITGEELNSLSGHTTAVTALAFNPDGTHLASGSLDSTIKLWDPKTAEVVATLTGHRGPVTALAFNPDGTRLASGSMDTTIKLWNPKTGEAVATLDGHDRDVTALAFNPDGTRLVSGSSDRRVKLWDPKTGAELTCIIVQSNSNSQLAFNPENSRVASTIDDNTIKIWDAQTGTELSTFTGHTERVDWVAFNLDATRLVSGSQDKTIKLWDSRTGAELITFTGHADGVYSVAFSPDGSRVASGGLDNTIKVWGDFGTTAEVTTLTGHISNVSSVAFSADGNRIVSGSWDKTVKIWDAQTRTELSTYTGHTDRVYCVALSADSTCLAGGSRDGTVKIWNVHSGVEVTTLAGHIGTVVSIDFSPDGTCLASLCRGWDPNNGKEIAMIKLFDARTGAELDHTTCAVNQFQKPEDIYEVIFSPDGTRIYLSVQGKKFVWERGNGQLPRSEQWVHANTEHRVSPNGRWLLSTLDSNIILVDLDFKNTPFEKKYREARSRLNPIWHRRQADIAQSENNWYAETLHRAWMLKSDPDQAFVYDQFHIAYKKMVTSFAEREKVLEPYLHQVVIEMLKMQRGNKISSDDAVTINNATWEMVKPRRSDQDISAVTVADLAQFRDLIAQNPRGIYFNTLGVLEYRAGNFQAAVDACTKSLELLPKEMELPGPHPGDLAVIAMSHHRLGNIDQANQFRAQLVEEMKLEQFKDDEECQSFAAEVEQLFASESKEEPDN